MQPVPIVSRNSAQVRYGLRLLTGIAVLAGMLSGLAVGQGGIVWPGPGTGTVPTLKIPTRVIFEGFADASAASAPQWMWLGEEPASWSVVGDTFLRLAITKDAGWLCSQNAHLNTLLLRDPVANGHDFIIETMVLFNPQANYQVANLVAYQDDGNFVALGRAFCAAGTGTPPAVCVGDGIYFDCEVGDCCFCRSGYPTGVPLFIAARDLGTTVPVWLRIVRSGNDYIGYYSLNARDWLLVGKHVASLSNVRVGLAVGTGGMGNLGPYADFDYFSLVQY